MQDPTQPNNQQISGVTPPVVPVSGPVSSLSTPQAPSVAMPLQGGVSQPVTTPASSVATSSQPISGVAPMETPAATPTKTAPGSAQPQTDIKAKDVPKKETTKNGDPQVKKADIEKIVSSWTGIPITKLTEDEGAKLLNLEKRIHQRLIDQEEAVTAVSEAVRRGRIGLASANRPIASFIFLGPSGTGKTELAKTLAEILFGKDDALIRLDMSEYMEKHEVAKLIGAPPGYVGYEEGGQLTEAVRAKPYSIVLLDEVEKAHPDVFNILLQVLEDGRLTDNKGNTISFKNTIVICTSNIGSALITQKLGEKDGKPQSEQEFDKEFGELTSLVSAELHKFFRPELLNRFDDIVIFKPLRRQDMAAIAKLNIAKTSNLLKEQEIKLKVSDKALAQLALEGYDPIYGARPLRRLIQTSIENPIAVLIIAKTFIAGDTIMIDYDQAKSDYSFRKATQEEIAADAKKVDDEKNKKSSVSTTSIDGKPTDEKGTQQNGAQASIPQQTPATIPLNGSQAPNQNKQMPPSSNPAVSNPAQKPLNVSQNNAPVATNSVPNQQPPLSGVPKTSQNGIGVSQTPIPPAVTTPQTNTS